MWHFVIEACNRMEDTVFLSLAVPPLVTIAVLGVLGNCLVFHAVLRHKNRQLNDLLILNLSVTDMGVCVVTIPLDLGERLTGRFPFGAAMCRLVYPFQSILLYVSVMTLLFMSCERYRLIVTPMKDKISVKTGIYVTVGIWLLSIVIILPYSFILEMNGSQCSEDWPSALYKKAFTLGVFIFLYLIPLLIITVLYFFVVRVLYEDIKAISSSSNRYSFITQEMAVERMQRNVKIVKIFVAAVVAFAVCMLPTHVSWLWHDFGDGDNSSHFVEVVTFTNVIMYSNSLINPFIFGSLKIGRLCKAVACCRVARESAQGAFFVLRDRSKRSKESRPQSCSKRHGNPAGLEDFRIETTV